MATVSPSKQKSESQANKILESPQGSTDDSETLCSKCAQPIEDNKAELTLSAQNKRLRERLANQRKVTRKIPSQLFQTKQGFEQFVELLNSVGKQLKLDLLIKNEQIMCEQLGLYFGNLEKEKKQMEDQINLKLSKEIQQLNERIHQMSEELLQISKNNNKQQIVEQPILVELPKALFIGQSEKTKLLSRLSDQSNFKEFELVLSKDKLFYLVDTPSFEFEDIDVREAQIQQYQAFFDKYSATLKTIFMMVNFERTDIMKKKLQDMYKFFRKLGYMLSIIVTDFDLSESKDDMEQLRERFKIFKVQQIIFVTKESDVLKDIKNAIPPFLDLKDTIFEKIEEEDQNLLMEQIANRIKR